MRYRFPCQPMASKKFVVKLRALFWREPASAETQTAGFGTALYSAFRARLRGEFAVAANFDRSSLRPFRSRRGATQNSADPAARIKLSAIKIPITCPRFTPWKGLYGRPGVGGIRLPFRRPSLSLPSRWLRKDLSQWPENAALASTSSGLRSTAGWHRENPVSRSLLTTVLSPRACTGTEPIAWGYRPRTAS